MTAGVVVMNAGAVALAADSTVTIPYRDGAKNYRGASKLLGLHPKAPVAVFWYGSPDYLGVPWEVVFKDFRRGVGNPPTKVSGYGPALFNYLDNELPRWEPGAPGDPPAAVLVQPLVDRVEKALEVRVVDPVATVDREIAEWKESLRPRRRVLDDADVDNYAPMSTWLDTQIDELGGGSLPEAAGQALRRAARSACTHLSTREPAHTGIVVAGFGDSERLPAMCSYLLGVPVGESARRVSMTPVVVSAENPAFMVPFAVNEHAQLFMEGIAPELKRWLKGALRELNELYELPEPVVDRIVRLLDDRIDAHGQPVTDAVRFLPKADLAEFARQIVAFTAFRLRMSMSVETVGEPIDVAVVSRSEGVVWVHRTNYFPPELTGESPCGRVS